MKSTNYQVYKKQQPTRAASQKIVRKRLRWFAIAIGAVASLVATTVAFALTPANGGLVGGTTVTINNGMGDQTDPHVNGDLAVYTDANGSSQIRYYDFVTTSDNAVPSQSGAYDILSDVRDNMIVFCRVTGGASAMLFDVSTHAVTEIAPTPSPAQFQPVLGGHQVAFIDLNLGNGDIMVFDLSANGPAINVSLSADPDDSPNLTPAGDAVVWERCNGANCDVLRSLNSGGTWVRPKSSRTRRGTRATRTPTAPPSFTTRTARPQRVETSISSRSQEVRKPSSRSQVSNGTQSINSGVIAFESDPGTGSADIYIYLIATNTLLQVTNSPSVNDTLNDITVLGNGDVRVVWSSNDLPGQNVYGRTFSLPATGDTIAPTVTITTPANGATYLKGQSVAGNYSCQDETGGSGLASCTGPVANGNPIDSVTVGSHSFCGDRHR
jgi:hypothetical protein